jgi:hypothetical protein
VVFDALAAAVDALDIPAEGVALGEALALRDRLEAKVADAVGRFDRAGGFAADGATSTQAWLRNRGFAGADAHRLVLAGRRLQDLPVLRSAWLEGGLSGGQVHAVAGNLSDRTVEMFADQEHNLVPAFARLSAKDVTASMQRWRQYADALLDAEQSGEVRRELHLSVAIGGRAELRGDLDSASVAVVQAALDAAATWDGEHDPRSAAHRRADALVEVCEHFLDLQDHLPERRNRPHVEIFLDAADLPTGQGASTHDGLLVEAFTVSRWLCDCTFNRILTDGKGVILDYGRTTNIVSHPLYRGVRARDKRCRWPGCDRKPAWCEAHHVWAWEHGGPTRLDKLVLVCRRHHSRLHRPGWHAKLLPDATFEITDPAGKVRSSRPPPSRK